MNITGTWRGQYAFDEVERLPKLPSLPINFEMKLKQAWFGFVSGTAQDDAKRAGGGFPEPAKITGRLKNNRLVITKQHPLIRLVHEGKFESTQQLADRFGVALDEFPPAHPKIRLAGDLSADGKTISGQWLMFSGEIHVPGGRAIQMPELRGTFTLTRAE